MGTTTATAILPLLLSPALAPSLGLIASPPVVVDGGGRVSVAGGWVGWSVDVKIKVLVDGGGSGDDVLSGGGSVGILDEVGVVDEGGGGSSDELVDGGGGGSSDEVVVVVGGGGGGSVDELGGGSVEVGGGGSSVCVDVSGSPLVLLDMMKVWRLSRGKFLYGADMFMLVDGAQ